MSIEWLAALGLAFALPSIWIWRWPASRWADLDEAMSGTGRVDPFAVLRAVPSLLGSFWVALGLDALLDSVAPHALESLPHLLGFVALAWWIIIPISVYMFGHPAILVPPGARHR